MGGTTRAEDLAARLQAFMDAQVYPNEARYETQLHELPAQQFRVPPILETLKQKARAEGLWNLFLPDSDNGAGLTNADYARFPSTASSLQRSPAAAGYVARSIIVANSMLLPPDHVKRLRGQMNLGGAFRIDIKHATVLFHARKILHHHRPAAAGQHRHGCLLEFRLQAKPVKNLLALPGSDGDPLIRVAGPTLKRKIAMLLINRLGKSQQIIEGGQKFVPPQRIDTVA
jgi:hypothetical protein